MFRTKLPKYLNNFFDFQNVKLRVVYRIYQVRLISSSQVLSRRKKDDIPLSTLFVPVAVKPNPDDINVGAELVGSLNKADLLRVLNKFYQRKEIKALGAEHGLDSNFEVSC